MTTEENKDIEEFIKEYGDVGRMLLERPECQDVKSAYGLMDFEYRGAFLNFAAFTRNLLEEWFRDCGYDDVLEYVDFLRFGQDMHDILFLHA